MEVDDASKKTKAAASVFFVFYVLRRSEGKAPPCVVAQAPPGGEWKGLLLSRCRIANSWVHFAWGGWEGPATRRTPASSRGASGSFREVRRILEDVWALFWGNGLFFSREPGANTDIRRPLSLSQYGKEKEEKMKPALALELKNKFS